MKLPVPTIQMIDLNRTKTPGTSVSEEKGEELDNISAETPEDVRVANVIKGNIRAVEVSTVFACVNLIVRNASQCRPEVRIRDRKTGGLAVLDSMNFLERLLRQPNNYQTPIEFYKQVFTNLRVTGNCFIYIDREFGDPFGNPVALYCLPTYAVRLRPIGTNLARSPSDWRDNYEYIPTKIEPGSWWGVPEYNTSNSTIIYSQLSSNNALGVGWNRPLPNRARGANVIPPEMMIHIRDTSLDGTFGWSTEQLFKELHGWERALQLRAAGHARKDGDSGAIVGIESTSAAGKAKEFLKGLLSGRRYVAVDGKVTVNKRGDNPRDSALVEQLKIVISEIGRIYGVPPSLLGDDRTTSSARGIEETNRQFVANAIAPLQELFSQALRQKIIPNWAADGTQNVVEVVWNRTHLLRASTQARTQFGSMMNTLGAWNVNDLRIAEGYPPLDPAEHPFAEEYIRGTGGGPQGEIGNEDEDADDNPPPDNSNRPNDEQEPEDEGGLE